jgi:hypothetical protein
MRIYPFTLRITHYSRAHPSWPGRPKIHFEGEMLQDNNTLTAIAPDGVTRRLRGTVQMAASGDVHWSLVRCILSFSPLLSLLALRGRGGVAVGKTDGCLLLGLLGWLGVFRNAIAKTHRFDGPARPYRSAGAARAWASSVYGPTRSTSYPSQSVRTQLPYTTPAPFTHLISLEWCCRSVLGMESWPSECLSQSSSAFTSTWA